MIMKELNAEVVVVGSGPAGAYTAKLLADKNHDVLLIDKDDFPRDKICGDALPAKALELLYNAGMGEAIDAAIAGGKMYPLNFMRLVSPKGHQRTYPLAKSAGGFSAAVAPRIYFDTLIREEAIRAGAKVHKATVEKPIIENGLVTGVRVGNGQKSTEIRAKVVIGADGVASNLARALRQGERHSRNHRAIALRAYAENIELNPQEVEFYIYDRIMPGYAWVFPLSDNRANIGLGMRLDHFHNESRQLKEMFELFLSLPLIKPRLKQGFRIENVASWPLNFGSQKGLQYTFPGALLVGDAGGFVSPLTGGGINRSLLSGQLAAEVVHQALIKDDPSLKTLAQYEYLCREKLLKSLRKKYYLTNTLFRFPGLVDYFVCHLNDKNPLAKAFTSKL
jgi:menaquinone-9 beta-reductase